MTSPGRLEPPCSHCRISTGLPTVADSPTRWMSCRLPSLLAAVVLLGHQLSVPTQNRLGRRDRCHCRQSLAAQRLAQHGQLASLRVGESHPLRSELLPQKSVLCLQIVDLCLENPAKPHPDPRCQKLQRQRQVQGGVPRGHQGAKIKRVNVWSAVLHSGLLLDITAICTDPLSAQDALSQFVADWAKGL